MPVLVTDHFQLDPSEFAATGAFNQLLDMDTLLFIDPALLRTTRMPELRGSTDRVADHFRKVILLLQQSSAHGDVFWNAASQKLVFPEVSGLAFGYSKKGTKGSGMGEGLRDSLLTTAKAIIDAGIAEPEIFELVGLFQEGVGADRIGDMIARIIRPDLEEFTRRVFSDLGVISHRSAELPTNPHNYQPILLAPCDVLRDLPVAEDWDDVDRVSLFNAVLRAQINEFVGSTWRAVLGLPKHDLLQFVLDHPELMREFVEDYRARRPPPYDMEIDRRGEVRWVLEGRRIATTHPLRLGRTTAPTIEQLERVVLDICLHFKRLVEDNGVSKSLYTPTKEPLPEAYLQRLFFVIADAYCSANNVDVTPEANSGRGPVDFKFSHGYDLRVLVEAKKSTNTQLFHGLETQLPTYQAAEQALRVVYLVVDMGSPSERMQKLREIFAGAPTPTVTLIVVDGTVYPPASKA